MLSFVTEFPVSGRQGLIEFRDAICEWILGSPHSCLGKRDFEELGKKDSSSVMRNNERVEWLCSEGGTLQMAAARYTKVDSELEWRSTVTFMQEGSVAWIGIRVSCESLHPSARLPVAKKPVLVKTLLSKFHGAEDGHLTVHSGPNNLDNSDIDVAARCLSATSLCRLPVVYVSATFEGDHNVDTTALALRLLGMAHVVVEPNRAFSSRLRIEVQAQNVYGGTIGIYWPDGGGRRSFFIGPQFESRKDLEDAIFEEVRRALTNRRPLARLTWAAVQERVSKGALVRLKEQGASAVDDYAHEFDKELAAKDEQLRDAEHEIARIHAELRRFEDQRPFGSGASLEAGGEQDFYPGEIPGIVREALSEALGRQVEGGRRHHVLSAVLEKIPANTEAAEKREQIKALLRGYRRMDAKTRTVLVKLGFDITEEGKHYKLLYQGDERYTFTLPKSGSDHRGGMNAASEISRRLF